MNLDEIKSEVVLVLPYSDEAIVNRWFARSKITVPVLRRRVPDNSSIPGELNRLLQESSSYNGWIVFCDQDVHILNDPFLSFVNRNREFVYGPIGAKLQPNNHLELYDGRISEQLKDDNIIVDSLGQGLIAIHSSAIRKYNLLFDEKFSDYYMIDFSIQCKVAGLEPAVVTLPSFFNEHLASRKDTEYYMKLLRGKYRNQLPFGFWCGTISDDAQADLKALGEQRNKLLKSLMNRNEDLYFRLSDLQKNLDEKSVWIDSLVNQIESLRSDLSMFQKAISSLSETTEGSKINEIMDSMRTNSISYDDFEKKLIWIFGTPRSGSTWLASEILAMRDGIRLLDETNIGSHLGVFWDDPMAYFNLLNGYVEPEFKRVIDSRQHSDDLFFAPKYENAWKLFLRNFIIDRFAAQFGHSGFDNIALKSPNESHAADVIMKCFPKSKLIFLIRDGRDVIDSRQSKFHNPRAGMGAETEAERKFRVLYFSKIWTYHVTITSKAYENHDANLRLLIRYEDLRSKPLEQIDKIFKFIGIRASEAEVKRISEETRFENVPEDQKGEDKNKRRASPGSWKQNFSQEEIGIMNRIMKENLVKFGYEI